jgi:hypothetical protein
LVGAENGIKTIAAVRSHCRAWAKSDGFAMVAQCPLCPRGLNRSTQHMGQNHVFFVQESRASETIEFADHGIARNQEGFPYTSCTAVWVDRTD